MQKTGPLAEEASSCTGLPVDTKHREPCRRLAEHRQSLPAGPVFVGDRPLPQKIFVQGTRLAGDQISRAELRPICRRHSAGDSSAGDRPCRARAEHSPPCSKQHLHAQNPHLLLLRAKDGVPDDLATIMLLLCKHLRGGGSGSCRRLSCTGYKQADWSHWISNGMADVAVHPITGMPGGHHTIELAAL